MLRRKEWDYSTISNSFLFNESFVGKIRIFSFEIMQLDVFVFFFWEILQIREKRTKCEAEQAQAANNDRKAESFDKRTAESRAWHGEHIDIVIKM